MISKKHLVSRHALSIKRFVGRDRLAAYLARLIFNVLSERHARVAEWSERIAKGLCH